MQAALKLFLRIAIGAGFLSAVADRFGWWATRFSAWGNMDAFFAYTGQLLPWLPASLVPAAGWAATVAETLLGLGLIIGFKTRTMAILSGILLLAFGLSMAFFTGIKRPLDASVFTAAAAAFALATMHGKFMELRA